SHCGAATSRRPDWSDERADDEVSLGNTIGKALKIVVGRIDADVRFEQKNIDAVKTLTVHIGRCRQIEHRIEIDEGFSPRTPLADKSRPHRIVDFRILKSSAHRLLRHFSLPTVLRLDCRVRNALTGPADPFR